ncbi:MAG: hypothetical protein LC792_22500, partial [Actinobacteria bacterium]|nr:hypothetical protein [Actinomycetota bacterium]
HIHVPDFEITADRTLDLDIPTSDLTVHVVDQDGRPTSGSVWGYSTMGDTTPIEIFPGGLGSGQLVDNVDTDGSGTATLLRFPGSPSSVGATGGGFAGSATVAPSARSVTVQLAGYTLSGTIRDARGPLPLVNWPWVSFGGPAGRYEEFDGYHLDADGTYALEATPGHQTLIITDEPDFDEDDTRGYAATDTLPNVWSIRADVNLTASRTLDLTIPDAVPAHLRAYDFDGLPMASDFNAASDHTVTIAPGLTGSAHAESDASSTDGRFDPLLFNPADTQIDIHRSGGGTGSSWSAEFPRLAPGDNVALALLADYDGGALMPPVATTTTTTEPEPPTTTPTTQPATSAGDDPTVKTSATTNGYWALGSDGHVYNFGNAGALGNSPAGAVDLEPSPSGNGYWILNRNGAVQGFGDAVRLGDVDTSKLANGELPASLSATPSGKGYWIFTNRGRTLTFGDAQFLGDMSHTKLNGPVLGSMATPSGKGYYMVASDGGIFAFGDATFAGSTGGQKLNAPVQSLVPDGDGHGYWLVASDGGIFAFDAPFRGSMGGIKLNKPVIGMVRYGDGYLMVGADGGIFTFSNAPFAGSLGDKPPATPVVAVAALP